MTAPLIGITTFQQDAATLPTFACRGTYVRAVQRAGGLPVLIPLGLTPSEINRLLNRLDGIIFTGGGDIDPQRYNGQPHPRVYGVDPERDRVETVLLEQAIAQRFPFMGICRGFQLLNVTLGGALYTDIADQFSAELPHAHEEGRAYDFPAHEVDITAETRLARFLGGTRFAVNSLHHQGVQRIGQGLIPSAHATDGLLEGVELPGNPFGLAVQWHPEWMPDSAPMQALFTAFIEAVLQEEE